MKKSSIILMVIMLSFALSLIFLGGCTKKTMVKEVSTAKEESTAKEKGAVVKDAGAEKMKKGDETTKSVLMKGKPSTEGSAKEVTEAGARKDKAAEVKGTSTFVDIHFDFDKYNLKSEDRAILKKDADWLAKHEKINVIIEGNCDERGTSEYNLALGQRRADEAMKYLVELGIDQKRIKTISYGKEKPLDPGHNEETWSKNRRDHFVAN